MKAVKIILICLLLIVSIRLNAQLDTLNISVPYIVCPNDMVSLCDVSYTLPFFPMTNDTLKVLIVFCNFPSPSGDFDPTDINSNYVYMNYWPGTQSQFKPNWADSIICPTTTNIWNPSLTGLFKQSSNNKFFLIGDVYDSLYIFKHQVTYYRDSGRGIGTAVKELLQNIDPYVNYSIYDKFDPYDLDHDGNKREKDGIVDFIYIAFRFTNSAIIDPPGYTGVAGLGGRYQTFRYESEITLDSTRILACSPGSGCLAEVHFPGHLGNVEHEFAQHYSFGSSHFDTMGVFNLNGGAIASSDDRDRLGWNQGIQYTPTTNDSIILRDYVTTGDYIKINRSNKIFIENRRRLNYYSSSSWNHWKYETHLPLFPVQRDSGILIYQKYYPFGDDKFKIEHADGKWEWIKCNSKYIISDQVFYNTFFHNIPNRITGETVMNLFQKPVVDIDCNTPIDPENFPRTSLSYIGSAGDSNSCFDIGYNQVYSPWSNPGIKVNSSSDSLTVELIGRNSNGDMIVKVYFTDITKASPSKPQLIKTARQFFGTPVDAFHTRITWIKNLEPDMKEYNIYRGSITTPGMDASTYYYIGTTTDTTYLDNSITLYRVGGGSGPCARYAVKYAYKVSAVDITNKESVKSLRDSVSGYSDPCGALGEDSQGENQNIQDIFLINNLSQNYPNPFNPITVIKYAIENEGLVTLKIYNILGKEIITLLNETKISGEYNIQFDASKYNLSSGIYYYKLVSNNFTQTKRMLLIK